MNKNNNFDFKVPQNNNNFRNNNQFYNDYNFRRENNYSNFSNENMSGNPNVNGFANQFMERMFKEFLQWKQTNQYKSNKANYYSNDNNGSSNNWYGY